MGFLCLESRVAETRRRWVLGGLGAAAVAAGAAWVARKPLTRGAFANFVDNNKFSRTSFTFEDSERCNLAATAVDGPFYVPTSPLRIDIRDKQIGQALHLKLKLVEATSCQPLRGAAVHIWHANALGQYSGYPSHDPDIIKLTPGHEPVENEDQFLRGHQITDANGRVDFVTVVPAWYSFRTPHIHVKALVGPRAVLTTQLYFPESMNTKIRQEFSPYRSRPEPIVNNQSDPVIRASKGATGGWLTIKSEGDKFIGSLTIGVSGLAPTLTAIESTPEV